MSEATEILTLLNAAPSTYEEPTDEFISDVVGDPFPPLEKRPCYGVHDDWIIRPGGKRKPPGVYHHTFKNPKGGEGFSELIDSRVCGPLHIDAQLADRQGGNFGRLLRFIDTRGRWKTWSMPMGLLAGDGAAMREELLNNGLDLDPRHRAELGAYLTFRIPKEQLESALTVGWHGQAFVLPGVVIGGDGKIHYQSPTASNREYSQAGTLDGWREQIASHCVGNPLLIFALSAAFAGPLLDKVHMDGGGVHYFGDSSTGKTTALKLAASVWGGREFKRSWKATANGLEGAASLFNDNILCLDELSESDPREAGAVVYSLGNGTGKQRANRHGAAREVSRWRCLIFSTGERTLAAHMNEGGKEQKAGQNVRLLDIPCERIHGIFDHLHGFNDGRALADHLLQAVGKHHGCAGRAFLERLVVDDTDFGDSLAKLADSNYFTAAGGESQEKRAGKLFALVAMAGELATEYGLTGWEKGIALEAATEAFRLWREHRGKGNNEQRQIVEKVMDFIDRHGDSRFSDVSNTPANTATRDRAGWWQLKGEVRQYLFTSGGLREALTGFDFKRSLDVLEAGGILDVSRVNKSDGRAKVFAVQGSSARLYVINRGANHVS